MRIFVWTWLGVFHFCLLCLLSFLDLGLWNLHLILRSTAFAYTELLIRFTALLCMDYVLRFVIRRAVLTCAKFCICLCEVLYLPRPITALVYPDRLLHCLYGEQYIHIRTRSTVLTYLCGVLYACYRENCICHYRVNTYPDKL
jgi:hypothetical protein